MQNDTNAPQNAAADSHAQARPRGKGCRRPEEDQPSEQYVTHMQKLGPRDRESILSFRKRIAAIREGRRLCIETWIACSGAQEACAKRLGVSRNSLAHELKMVGLSSEILDALIKTEH